MANTNLRAKAIDGLMQEAKNRISDNVMLYQALRRINDMDLFALYIEVFGHPVDTEAGNVDYKVRTADGKTKSYADRRWCECPAHPEAHIHPAKERGVRS